MNLIIDNNLSKAIYVQIVDGIISSIKSGVLRPGSPLPSSRQLASELKINRNTVVKAFEILSAEGWITSSERQRTVVSKILPITAYTHPN